MAIFIFNGLIFEAQKNLWLALGEVGGFRVIPQHCYGMKGKIGGFTISVRDKLIILLQIQVEYT